VRKSRHPQVPAGFGQRFPELVPRNAARSWQDGLCRKPLKGNEVLKEVKFDLEDCTLSRPQSDSGVVLCKYHCIPWHSDPSLLRTPRAAPRHQCHSTFNIFITFKSRGRASSQIGNYRSAYSVDSLTAA
jgi:hypothetical protein